jgi:hypothetical protein
LRSWRAARPVDDEPLVPEVMLPVSPVPPVFALVPLVVLRDVPLVPAAALLLVPPLLPLTLLEPGDGLLPLIPPVPADGLLLLVPLLPADGLLLVPVLPVPLLAPVEPGLPPLWA